MFEGYFLFHMRGVNIFGFKQMVSACRHARFKHWVKLEFGALKPETVTPRGERIDGEANRHSQVRWRFGENGAMINQD